MNTHLALLGDKKTETSSFGPTSSSLGYTLPKELRKHMLRCSNYISGISLFKQYIVWRYTLGSTPINRFLIMGKIMNENNTIYWVYLFILYWKNTVNLHSQGLVSTVSPDFVQFSRFFDKPSDFLVLRKQDALKVALDIIQAYAKALQSIILECPPVVYPFDVYKVASDYPGLPTATDKLPKTVPQVPFNSTTLDPHFNFALFSEPGASGNLFKLSMPAGSRILYVPSLFHAYPFQKEIILPFNSQFIVNSIYTGILDTIDPRSVKINTLQEPKESISMGPVYELSEYTPCKSETGACIVKPTKFRVFVCDYSDKDVL